jgi:hypothetical protein
MWTNEEAADVAMTRGSFFECTKELRRNLILKKTEYRKASERPAATPERLRRLERAIKGLEARIRRRWPK